MVAPEEVPAGEQAFHRRIWRHRVGAPTDADTSTARASTPEHRPRRSATTPTTASTDLRDGRWLLVTGNVGTARRDSVWIADLHARRRPDAGAHPGRRRALRPWVDRDGRLYLLTTDGAPRFRLAVTDPATPGREHWRELVAEDPDAVLDGVALAAAAGTDDPADGLLVLARSRHAVAELALHDRDGTPRRTSRCPGPARCAA